MPPRRRDRGRGQFQEESEGQNEEMQRSVPRRGRDRQHTAAPPQDRGGSSRGRSFPAPQQRLGEPQFRPFQQPGPSRFGQSSHPQFSGPQFAQVNAMTREQAKGTPGGGIIADPPNTIKHGASPGSIHIISKLGLRDAGIDQLNFHSVQLGYLKLLQMGNTDPNNKSRKRNTRSSLSTKSYQSSKHATSYNQCYECMRAIKKSDS
ncbi:hypothetical protein F511_22415 [Dorcoceras hygrometricum]|uniref:Uncharacterized protein n=1 Tax=Dorcoceras hygrometricum TaxID=472368 RepID=A0A2Z7BVP5_9LAMI|nr:hypothetical protein F511_22415 [Dorcoceras hygrometricum]